MHLKGKRKIARKSCVPLTTDKYSDALLTGATVVRTASARFFFHAWLFFCGLRRTRDANWESGVVRACVSEAK